MTGGRVFLKPGRDGLARGGNPWIFSHAIERIEPAVLQPGAPVEVRDSYGGLIGAGYINPNTTIAVRILFWDAAPAPAEILRHRLAGALKLRERIIAPGTDCYRLINGDGDGLSGVVIDRYGEAAVVQLLTAGADLMRAEIVAELKELIAPRAIVERSTGAVRRQEGLEDRVGVLVGEPPSETVARERGFALAIDLVHGQKTGWFIDQRENRALAEAAARGARVLDGCCYAGGFALAALRGGAREVVAVDTSERALGWTRRNLELHGGAAAVQLVHQKVGDYMAAARGRFDLIVLDPPPLARSQKDAPRAGRLYAELNLLALKALAPGGTLLTFSCSVHLKDHDFIRAVRIAQTRSGRRMRLMQRLGPAPDHPVLLGHAEGEYLSGLMLCGLD